MGLSLRLPLLLVPMEAEDILGDGMIVRVGAADNKCRLPGGASPATSLLGVVYRPDQSLCAVGDTIDVCMLGIVPVRAGDTVTRGAFITSDGTDGTGQDEAASAGVNVGVIGQALESGVAGDRCATFVNPFIKQGG